MISDQELLKMAFQARKKGAVAKLSGYKVGAAILAKSGRVYTAGNIECDIPTLAVCADRLALFMALSAGERRFEKIAVVTETKRATPCGCCRQILFEFCGPRLKIISQNTRGKKETKTLAQLLPHPYKKER